MSLPSPVALVATLGRPRTPPRKQESLDSPVARKELAASRTTVNALAPGFIEATPFHDTFTSQESKLATIAAIPAGRAGTPHDVAGVAAWLAGPTSGYVNGAIIDINGAQYFG